MKYKKKNIIPPAKTMRLRDNHSWDAPKGYKIFVAERGLVSFNIPDTWLLVKLEPHIEFNDAEPPDDDARISVSYWRNPPGVDWTGLPLGPLLEQSAQSSEMEILERTPIVPIKRDDLEVAWTQHKFMDPKEHREAYSRLAVARGFTVHVLITCDFWADDTKRIIPIWEEVIRSLQLDRVIADPTRGVIKH